ncbi:hypothetical protein Mapa_015158 [Marchantia paleacea]|nr:hypothetical protein Mapa_015158 [Marchantia paleacea]
MSFPMAPSAKRMLSMDTPMGVPWKLPPCRALSLATSMSGLSFTEFISRSIECVAARITSICGPSHCGDVRRA